MCERTIVSKNTKNCDMCGETFTPVSDNNRFCVAECRVRWWANHRMKRRCLECGNLYMGLKGQKLCSLACSTSNLSQINTKWTENEIIYLASINEGYGFKRFVTALWSRDGTESGMVALSGFDSFKEKTGIDYYEILQDPSKMKKVTGSRLYRTTRAYPDRTEEFAWAITASAREKGRKRKTDKHLQFNWGTFADDPRAQHDEGE